MPIYKRGVVYHGYVTVNGVRTRKRSTGCRDEKAALAVLAEWERELADPAYASSKAALLGHATDAVLKLYAELVRVGKKSPATESYYTDKLGTLARILGRESPLSELRQPRGALLLDGYVSQRREEGATEHTISKELSALKLVLKHAKRAGWWSGDAGAIFPPSFSAGYEPRDRTPTPDEIVALLWVVPSRDTAAQIAYSAATSAELGALQRAQRMDIAPDRRFTLVRGTKRDLRWRTVPIVTEAQRWLLDFALENAEGEGPFLFKHTQSLPNALRRACKLLGIPHTSANDLRRAFAVSMREAGFPLELIAPMMGHSDTRMLERVYGRLSPEQLRERLVRALNAVAVCSMGVPDGVEIGQTETERNLVTPRKLAPRAGFEPATYGLTGQTLMVDYTVPEPTWRFLP